MFKGVIKFIHDLRIFFFAMILFSSLYTLGASPVAISRFVGAKISNAIGISTSTSVPANPFNTLSSQLAEKEKKLADRENQLNRKEAELDKGLISQKNLIYILSFGIVLLFGLILLNFYFDYRRKKQKN